MQPYAWQPRINLAVGFESETENRMDSDLGVPDSIVAFDNSQGDSVQGTLVRHDRNSCVLEVYNPYSIVQLSEVLNNVRIRRGDRNVYTGRAVVTNLVNTGIMVMVSASLVDPWSDVNDIVPGPQLQREVANFVDNWSTANRQLRKSYQSCVSDARNFLEELNRWVDHSEAILAAHDQSSSSDLLLEFVQDVDSQVIGTLNELFGRFEEEARAVPEEDLLIHKAFARRELHPLMLCAPFMHRAFNKPLGYAGDYLMVDMILRSPYEGPTSYAKVLNKATLRTDTAEAHRNRIVELTQLLENEARRASELRRPIRVLNIGCGPAVELQRFLAKSWLSDKVDLTLVDFNEPTLEFAEAKLREIAGEHSRKTTMQFVHRSVHELLKQALRAQDDSEEKYDLVYCAGLFDYLTDKVCSRLTQLFYRWLHPGGAVMVTNVHADQPVRGFMEHLQEWSLVLRNEQQMVGLVPGLPLERIYVDMTGANVFMLLRCPGEGAEEPH